MLGSLEACMHSEPLFVQVKLNRFDLYHAHMFWQRQPPFGLGLLFHAVSAWHLELHGMHTLKWYSQLTFYFKQGVLCNLTWSVHVMPQIG